MWWERFARLGRRRRWVCRGQLPDRNLETGLGGTPGPAETDRPEDGRTEGRTRAESATAGRLPPASWGGQAEDGGAAPAQGGARQASPEAVRSRQHRIGDGEIVQDGFVRPLARLVRRQALTWIRWRPKARRASGKAQMVEDLPHD